MNRFNNKKYYKPPPVKPSNRLREKPKEEWNPYQNDLNKYKLSNAEILKKKINATSKNLEEAKRDWQGQIAMIQNGKMKINFDDDMEGKQKIIRKKIDLTPMNRFEKRSVNIDAIRNNDRNIYQNNRINRPFSGYEDNYRNKTKKNNSFGKKNGNNFYNNDNLQLNHTQDNNFYDDEDDDGEIKMVYNTGNNANVIETKIKKENNFSNYNNDISNNAAFNEFEKTIQKMQEHLQQKNQNKENNFDIKQNEVNFYNENNMVQKQNIIINNSNNISNRKNESNLNKKQNKKINKKNISNNPNKKEISNNNTNPTKNKTKKAKFKTEENKLIDDLKKDINDKFNNLEGINELDNCMKQLDFMIAKSKQKSIQNRLNDDSKNPKFYRSENENFYQNRIQNEQNIQMPEQNNKYLENINDKFQPSYKKNIKQNNAFKDTNNKMKNFTDDKTKV